MAELKMKALRFVFVKLPCLVLSFVNTIKNEILKMLFSMWVRGETTLPNECESELFLNEYLFCS